MDSAAIIWHERRASFVQGGALGYDKNAVREWIIDSRSLWCSNKLQIDYWYNKKPCLNFSLENEAAVGATEFTCCIA